MPYDKRKQLWKNFCIKMICSFVWLPYQILTCIRASSLVPVVSHISWISSVCKRNGEIKTERQRVSRDLAVRCVVLPGCRASFFQPTMKMRNLENCQFHSSVAQMIIKGKHIQVCVKFPGYSQLFTWSRGYVRWVFLIEINMPFLCIKTRTYSR
jgi:hypothetical protein